MRTLTPYRRGLLIATLGVLFIAPDSLLILMAQQPPANLMFWRNGMMSILFLVVIICARHHIVGRKISLAKFFPYIYSELKKVWMVVICYPLTSVSFLYGVLLNNAASNLIILATAPLIGALLNAIFLKKKVPRDNWLAIIGVLLGISLVAADGLISSHLAGMTFSFAAAFFFALFYFLLQNKTINPLLLIWAMATSNMLFALPFVSWGGVSQTQYLIMFVNAFASIGLSFLLTSYATRFIAAEETLLIFMLETLLGPLLVWWVLGQEPTARTLVGGVVVMTVITIWTYKKMTQRQKT
ncbi:MAG: DMT family transporter [Alphaproteobacteria bacterium]|nr:DMT family transporter [Alphaproteobacteria bacterium]